MANFSPSEKKPTDFNGGVKLVNKKDAVDANDINNVIESALYSQKVVTDVRNKLNSATGLVPSDNSINNIYGDRWNGQTVNDYIAPANGYVGVFINCNDNPHIELDIRTRDNQYLLGTNITNNAYQNAYNGFVPVAKGQRVRLIIVDTETTPENVTYFSTFFVYAEAI